MMWHCADRSSPLRFFNGKPGFHSFLVVLTSSRVATDKHNVATATVLPSQSGMYLYDSCNVYYKIILKAYTAIRRDHDFDLLGQSHLVILYH